MPTAVLILVVCLAVVLLTSGIAKVRTAGSASELEALGVPQALQQGWLIAAHPWVEIALGVGLLVTGGWLLVAFALAATALLAFYLVLVTRVMRTGEAATCNCFGSLGESRLTWRTVWRNGVLTSLGVIATVAAATGFSVPRVVQASPSALLALAAAAVVAVVTWLVTSSPSEQDAVTDELAPAPGGEHEDYLRLPTPYVRLAAGDGSHVTLRDLASQRARLLVFMSTTCHSCVDLAAQVRAWVDEFDMVQVHPVILGTREMTAEAFPDLVEAALFDPDHSVLQTFSLAGVPAAVLLGTDGLLAGGPVTGGNAIADMVDEMRVQLSDATDLAPAQPGDESEQVASPA